MSLPGRELWGPGLYGLYGRGPHAEGRPVTTRARCSRGEQENPPDGGGRPQQRRASDPWSGGCRADHVPTQRRSGDIWGQGTKAALSSPRHKLSRSPSIPWCWAQGAGGGCSRALGLVPAGRPPRPRAVCRAARPPELVLTSRATPWADSGRLHGTHSERAMRPRQNSHLLWQMRK